MTISISSCLKLYEIYMNYRKFKLGSRKSHFHVFKVLPLKPDRQTDGQNIYRIDAYIWEECAGKKIRVRENQVSIFLNFRLL